MAVAYDSTNESHTGITGSQSEASFAWNHVPTGTLAGLFIFLFNLSTNADIVSALTFGGVTVPAVSNGTAQDTATEAAFTKAYHLGTAASIPAGTQSIAVTRTNNPNILWGVSIGVTGSGDTEVYVAGIVKLEEDGTLAEQSVDDGSPGTNSLRVAGIASGLPSPPAAGASSTLAHDFDPGARTAAVVRETTVGQGSRSIGFSSGTSDDRAALHMAIREVPSSALPPRLTIVRDAITRASSY